MADQNAKLLDLDEIWYSEVCGSLITSPSSKFGTQGISGSLITNPNFKFRY